MRDPYLYPSSDVLINKFNEHDIEKLNIIEAEYTSLAISEIIEN